MLTNINHKIRQKICYCLIFVSVLCLAVVFASNAKVALAKDSASESEVLRGRYLVTITACADCHSPRQTPNDPYWLAGYLPGTPGQPFEVGDLKVFASNITPDLDTGIGKWTPQQVFNSMRQGKHNNGKFLCPPMPWQYYRYMTDEDTWAIVAYLQSLKPVKNIVPNPTTSKLPKNKHGANHADKHPDCSIFYKGLKGLPAYPGINEVKVPGNQN
ncbi:MAG TPA: c-type cytochrome [Oculatellaceae cyanobacterium]|jgi:mono/diheme cytochrome c family protein